MVVNKRFDPLGHIYQIQQTSLRNELICCTYTGVHFIKVHVDKQYSTMSLHLNPLCYITEQFVNKVIEYDHGRFLAAIWDATKYVLIDHEQETMGEMIAHPKQDEQQVRCWGLAKLPDFSLSKLPFIIARDNTGLVLIDIK